MHYHGDGIKHNPREIYVSVDNERSSYKPKVHHSVAQLLKSSKVSVAEHFESFTTVTPVIYQPGNLHALVPPLKLVR